jgi:hypothetical protein
VTGAAVADEQTYNDDRARNLERMLVALSDRIRELAERGELLPQAAELMRLVGDVKSELFHYEVRITYDSPEVAEHRRLVEDAKTQGDPTWKPTNWSPDDEESPEW